MSDQVISIELQDTFISRADCFRPIKTQLSFWPLMYVYIGHVARRVRGCWPDLWTVQHDSLTS